MTAEKLYAKGLAIGRSDIVSGCWHFRHYETVYTVLQPIRVKQVCGYHVAKVALVKRAANG